MVFFSLTKKLAFQRICEGTNCSEDAQTTVKNQELEEGSKYLTNRDKTVTTVWHILKKINFLCRLKCGVENNRRIYLKM
jgi:hypothetical protein